ncbi:serine--tRNA ligase [Patescibacteria group bacterium]|nr:serine--tRNA ligase [Patescibacteria group bacterium]
MIDLKLIRDEPDLITNEVERRGMKLDVMKLIRLDGLRREYQSKFDDLRAEQKRIKDAKAGKAIKEKLKKIETDQKKVNKEFDLLYLQLPNISESDIPTDADEEVKEIGNKPKINDPKPHYEIPGIKPLIDFERGAKVSGNRFWFLKGALVDLEFALIRYAMDYYQEKGFVPMRPPSIVNEEAMFGTGFFPAEVSEIYAVEDETEKDAKKYLSGTSEVPLASYHASETLDELPVKYIGFAPVYRREAGSYGKDTKGIMRGHEFDKLELFIFSDPSKSWEAHEKLQKTAEEFWTSLGIPFRVLNICARELGAPNAKKYDIEAWLPGDNKYMEVASNSNDTDFQARRLKIKHNGEFVHTLNNTAVAIGRAIIAITENYQNDDGSVDMPQVLHEHLSFKKIEPDGTTT